MSVIGVILKFIMINFSVEMYGCLWAFMEEVSFGYGLWNKDVSWLCLALKGFGYIFNVIKDGVVVGVWWIPTIEGLRMMMNLMMGRREREEKRAFGGFLKQTPLIWIFELLLVVELYFSGLWYVLIIKLDITTPK